MSTNACEGNQSYPHDTGTVTELTEDADQGDIIDAVQELVETVEKQQESIEDLEQKVEKQQARIDELESELCDEREQRARDDAELRKRVTDVEDSVEADHGDADPGFDGEKAHERTPVERLAAGDSEDVAEHVTPSIERAVDLFENLPDWGKSTQKGIVLRPKDKPKDLLEASRDESLAWQQYYRACEALERLSKGAVTFVETERHGRTLVLHADSSVTDRLRSEDTGHSQSMLVAD